MVEVEVVSLPQEIGGQGKTPHHRSQQAEVDEEETRLIEQEEEESHDGQGEDGNEAKGEKLASPIGIDAWGPGDLVKHLVQEGNIIEEAEMEADEEGEDAAAEIIEDAGELAGPRERWVQEIRVGRTQEISRVMQGPNWAMKEGHHSSSQQKDEILSERKRIKKKKRRRKLNPSLKAQEFGSGSIPLGCPFLTTRDSSFAPGWRRTQIQVESWSQI